MSVNQDELNGYTDDRASDAIEKLFDFPALLSVIEPKLIGLYC